MVSIRWTAFARARTPDLAAGRLAEAVMTSRSFGEGSDFGQTRKSARLNGKSVLPPTTDLVGPPRGKLR
jgi:hypothetical protein